MTDDTRPTPLERVRDALAPELQVKREIGRGSMATVYLAREVELDRLVAIKALHPSWASDETARRRFEREAKSAASLAHPNVVEVFRFGRLPDQTPYLVMRFVKGRTLEDRIEAEERLPIDLARRVLIDVASALAAAHAEGIVHRDVRPANVLWDEQREAALLTDFGIAGLLDTASEEVTRLTKTGQMVGDPKYLSPEQLRDEPLTELGDMYSFGVMGYELLTGSGPYRAKTNMQWIKAHLDGEVIDIRELRPEVDEDLAALLARCLKRQPRHRPSASDVVRILEHGGSLADVAPSPDDAGSEDSLDEIFRRRVPTFLGWAAGIAAGFLAFVAMLVEMDTFGPIAWDLALRLAACGFIAAMVVTWFHGEEGRQRSRPLEWVLLGVIFAVWIGLSMRVLIAG